MYHIKMIYKCLFCKENFNSHNTNPKFCSKECFGHWRVGYKNPFFGKKHKKKALQKMRLAKLGKPGNHLGKTHSKKARKKMSLAKIGKKPWNFGTRKPTMIKHGYVLVFKPDHPYKNKEGYVRQHRLVMEKSIRRYLNKSEVVHHINFNKQDNRIENLKLYASNREHENTEHKHRKNIPKTTGTVV